MENRDSFNSALYGVSERIREKLEKLPTAVRQGAEEIRLRTGLPVALTVGGETVFVLESGKVSFYITQGLLRAEKRDVEESFRLLCKNSAFAHSEELKNGFIMMEGGHRAGVCGRLTENGVMHDVSSVNIRIAREIFGAANDIARAYKGGGLCGRIYRVAVIDSRGEISGSSGGIAYNDLGAGTDVLLTADKAAGLEIAVRTMFPDIVAFDEIGTERELAGVSGSFNAGVSIITTAHAGGEEDLMRRAVTRELIKSGAVNSVAFLPSLLGRI